MLQIRPITELRNINEISELCHSQKEPIIITKNGYGDLVIMSIETYERELAISDVYKKLIAAEIQISEGKVYDADEFFEKLRAEYVEPV